MILQGDGSLQLRLGRCQNGQSHLCITGSLQEQLGLGNIRQSSVSFGKRLEGPFESCHVVEPLGLLTGHLPRRPQNCGLTVVGCPGCGRNLNHTLKCRQVKLLLRRELVQLVFSCDSLSIQATMKVDRLGAGLCCSEQPRLKTLEIRDEISRLTFTGHKASVDVDGRSIATSLLAVEGLQCLLNARIGHSTRCGVVDLSLQSCCVHL